MVQEREPEGDDASPEADLPKGDAPGTGEELSANAEIHKGAWQATIDDMNALAEEFREEGWDTVITAIAGDSAPEPPEDGPSGRFGIVHVLPETESEQIREAVADGEGFPKYDVFRAEREGRVFLVTEFLDPETSTAVFVAGNFERHRAVGLVRAAKEEGKIFSHLQKLDGTVVATFEHDDLTKFFPEADRLVEDLAYDTPGALEVEADEDEGEDDGE